MSWRLGAVVMLAAGALAGAGCGPIALPDIDSSQDFNVPGRGFLAGNPFLPSDAFKADVIGQALAQSIQSSIDTSGYDKSHVSSLKLTGLTLTVKDPTNPQGQKIRDLSFLQKLTVFLGAQGDDTGKVKVAESKDGDFGEKPIKYDVPLTNAELAPVFKASDQLSMTSDVTPGQPPAFDTTVTVSSKVHVEVSVF